MPPQAVRPKGSSRPPEKFVMPPAPTVVLWRHAPGGEASPAAVTKVGKQALSLMIFPPDSRVGVPKDGVRFIDDPFLKANVTDGGVWDYTDEHKLLMTVAARMIPDRDGNVASIPPEATDLLK